MVSATGQGSKAGRLLANAVCTLMDQQQLSQARLAQLTLSRDGEGVSQRHIHNVLSEETGCSVEVAWKLAAAFNMPLWQLLLPGRANHPKVSAIKLEKLVAAYLHADDSLRSVLDKLAEQA